MKTLNLDLRERIVLALEGGGGVQEVADRFLVSHDSVRRLQLKWERGESLAPRVRRGRAPRVGADQEAALVSVVQAHPSATIEEMSEVWEQRSGQTLPRSTMHDALKRVRGRYKKIWEAQEAG